MGHGSIHPAGAACLSVAGARLCGGTGSVARTVVGDLPSSVSLEGLVILDVSLYTQRMLVGPIVSTAVAFDHFS